MKATILLCLLFFATTMVTSIAAASFVSLPNIVNVTDYAPLYSGSSIEPLGDPVDIVDAPN